MSDQIMKGLHLELVQGDDYLAADGRQVVVVGAGVRWPATVASVRLFAHEPGCACALTVPAAVLDVVGEYTPSAEIAANASFDLGKVLTLTLAKGVRRYDFEIRATLESDSVVTLATGFITVT